MNFGYNIYHRECAPPILKARHKVEVPKAVDENLQIINNEPKVDNVISETGSNMTELTARYTKRDEKKIAEANINIIEENSFDRLTFSYFLVNFVLLTLESRFESKVLIFNYLTI